MADDFHGCHIEEILDNETGEKNRRKVYFRIHGLPTDAETGEPDIEHIARRRQFQSSGNALRSPENHDRRDFRRKTTCERYFQKQQINSNLVKNVIICTRKNVGPIAFILPTLLVCSGWASIVCLLGEACMHIWYHKRSRKEKKTDVEYRSPLHLISSQFCIHCRSQKWMEKISEIQDKRTLRRKSGYSTFMSRLVR